MVINNERISKYSYSEVVKNLLARDVLKSRNSPHDETEKDVNHHVESSSASQNPTIDFKYEQEKDSKIFVWNFGLKILCDLSG